jgi:hypothetical protein
MLQEINWVVVPLVTPKGRGGGRTQNLMIILKILRTCNLNSKINLKMRVELKMFSYFVKRSAEFAVFFGLVLKSHLFYFAPPQKTLGQMKQNFHSIFTI